MMSRWSATALLTTILSPGIGLRAQEVAYPINKLTPTQQYHQDRTTLLIRNTHKLAVSVTMDRQEYLPGEAAQIRITITNPTFEPLEVFDPFLAQTGKMEMLEKKIVGQTASWNNVNPDAYGAPRSDQLPTRFMAASETLERKLFSYDDRFDKKERLIRMPEEPGEYRLVYTYAGQPVDFKMVPARLELIAYVVFEKEDPPLQYGSGASAKMVRVPRDARVAVLGAGGFHHILISR